MAPDGQHYTRSEFELYFGGLDEWQAAATPAGGVVAALPAPPQPVDVALLPPTAAPTAPTPEATVGGSNAASRHLLGLLGVGGLSAGAAVAPAMPPMSVPGMPAQPVRTVREMMAARAQAPPPMPKLTVPPAPCMQVPTTAPNLMLAPSPPLASLGSPWASATPSAAQPPALSSAEMFSRRWGLGTPAAEQRPVPEPGQPVPARRAVPSAQPSWSSAQPEWASAGAGEGDFLAQLAQQTAKWHLDR
jgi:hypothetical protein